MRTAILLAAIGAAAAAVMWRLHRLERTIVAKFDSLDAKLDEEETARAAAIQRINDDVQALRDQIAALQLDTEDQAKVDAIVGRVQSNIDAFNAIDPVASTPEPEQTPEP